MTGTDDYDYAAANDEFVLKITDRKLKGSCKRRIAGMRKKGVGEAGINVWIHTTWPVIIFFKQLDVELSIKKAVPPPPPRGPRNQSSRLT